MAKIYLAEITARDAVGADQVLRFSTGRGYNHPSAPGFYHPRLLQPANAERSVFGDGRTFGAASLNYGAIEVANLGELDYLTAFAFGRTARILAGDEGAAYSSFVIILSGTVEQPSADWDSLTFRWRDKMAELDRPVSATLFAGNNVLPNGVEGTAEDLLGLPKPILYGEADNFAPPLVNTAKLIYQIADKPIAAIRGVWDGGVPLTAGAARADFAALVNTVAPTAGRYDWYSGTEGSFIRLGSTPAREVTVSADEGATAATRTAGRLFARILSERAGVAAGLIDLAAVAALDSKAPGPLGLWTGTNETTISELLSAVASSVGAFYTHSLAGVWTIGRIEAPAGPPVATFRRLVSGMASQAGEGDIVSLEWLPTNDEGRGVPSSAVRLSWGRNYTAQDDRALGGDKASTGDPVGGLARRQYLRAEWRYALASAPAAVLSRYPAAKPIEFETLLRTQAAAQAEAERRRDLYAARQLRFRAGIVLGPAIAPALELGSVVRLQVPRFGLSAGVLFLVIGTDYNAARNAAVLDLWGMLP